MSNLGTIRVRFTALIITGLLLAALAGLGCALLFGLTTPAEMRLPRTGLYLGSFMAAMLLTTGVYFFRYFSGLKKNHGTGLEQRQQQQLARFSRDYWGIFLFYTLAAPVVFFLAVGQPLASDPARFFQLLLLQLSAVTLVGLPTFQLAQDLIGRLGGELSLQKIHVSLKSRFTLLGGFVPLLSYSVLMNYQWQQSGELATGHLAIWLTLVVITGMITLLTVRSVTRALAPVQEIFLRSGASTHTDLAQLSARSNDEIGFMTQALGKLFRRLGEQETHMRAVVETAAEGIIVVNDKGLIETFNPAAEKLFGYLASEIRQQPLKWLLPELVNTENMLTPIDEEREVEGLHRNGAAMQLSVRVSEMHINGQRLFTCLVADITRRKATEAQLRDAENRYRDLVETAHDLVWTLDSEGRFTYLNRACTAIYGYSSDEMMQRRIHEFRSPEHAPVDEEAIDDLLSGRLAQAQFETVHLANDGKPHFLSFSAKTHIDETGSVIPARTVDGSITSRLKP